MKKYISLPFTMLALAACDAQKTPITGTRIPVVSYESSVKVDGDTKGILVSLPLSETNQNWPQFGGSADHGMINSSLKESIQPLWKASLGSGSEGGRFLSTPIVAKGVLYGLDTYGRVSALQTSSGDLLWATNIFPEESEEGIIGGGLAYGDGKIFVTSPHAEVLCLDAKSGAVVWRYSTSSPVRAAPTLADGRLYVLNISNELDVLDANKGVPLWNHAGITEHAGLLGTASPAVAKGVVVVTYSSGEVFALKAENGHVLWTETLSTTRRPDSLSSLSHIKALPVIKDNSVIIVGHNQKMAAYDLSSGERVWERNIGGTRTPAVIGDFIFMINSHNELVCLTRKHGQVVWVKKLESALENPTKVIWQGPIVAGGKLYLISAGGMLLTINPNDGKTISSKTIEAPVSLPPFVAQETLYLLTDEGEVQSFK